jgi:hypothetical protein
MSDIVRIDIESDPGLRVVLPGMPEQFLKDPKAGKEFYTIFFQAKFVNFVIWMTSLVIGWLIFIFTFASLNVPDPGKIFRLKDYESGVIITAIAVTSLGFTSAIIKGLFSIQIQNEIKKPLSQDPIKPPENKISV